MADKSTRQKRYTEEFRLQAAKLIVEGGYHLPPGLPATGRQRLGLTLLGQSLPGLRTPAGQRAGGPAGRRAQGGPPGAGPTAAGE